MFNWILTHSPILYFTQSLWRDEAFSILTAQKPILSFIGQLNFEPPFYYVLLHFWIKVVGTSEIAVRSLSLLGFILACVVVIYWAEAQFEKHWLSWFVPITFFLNPMLLYYAFEIRAYGWLIFFSTLSIYAYTQKKYWLLSLANIFAFYTHSYALFIPFIQCVHYVATIKHKRQYLKKLLFLKDKYFLGLVVNGFSILPWFIPIIEEAKKMRPTWYYPVDLQLIKSVLGNIFVGYDGTPGGLWGYTATLSLIIAALCVYALFLQKKRHEVSYLFTAIFLPLIIIIGVSFVKPMFVNRYVIFVTIAEVLLIGYALYTIQQKTLQKIAAVLLLIFILGVSFYLPSRKAKLDIRHTIQIAESQMKNTDMLYIKSPLLFFESFYYAKDKSRIFLYNPSQSPFPWYVGETAFSTSQMRATLPAYPSRAIMIEDDGSISISYTYYTTSTQTELPQKK